MRRGKRWRSKRTNKMDKEISSRLGVSAGVFISGAEAEISIGFDA
jgi:hypothetical protein